MCPFSCPSAALRSTPPPAGRSSGQSHSAKPSTRYRPGARKGMPTLQLRGNPDAGRFRAAASSLRNRAWSPDAHRCALQPLSPEASTWSPGVSHRWRPGGRVSSKRTSSPEDRRVSSDRPWRSSRFMTACLSPPLNGGAVLPVFHPRFNPSPAAAARVILWTRQALALAEPGLKPNAGIHTWPCPLSPRFPASRSVCRAEEALDGYPTNERTNE